MTVRARGTLENCPRCLRKWPESATHDLRSLVWLDGLPRGISASNADALFFHDGRHGADRFLLLETKRHGEPWQAGQEWLLRALAGQSGWIVRVLRGTLDHLTVHRVTPTGIEEPGSPARPEAFRSAVADWLDGSPWRDPARLVAIGRPIVAAVRVCPSCKAGHPIGTTCGWAAAQ